MRHSLKISLATIALAGFVGPTKAEAQDFSACPEIYPMIQAEDYGEALWLLDRCKNGVETAWFNGIIDVLNVPIEGLEPSGGEVEGALGINTVKISHGPIETTFTSGAGSSESPMAGLGAIASLGSAFGVRQPGVEEVRLGRRTTGRLEEKSNGSFSLMVTIDDGVLVQDGPDSEQLQAFAIATIRLLEGYFGN